MPTLLIHAEDDPFLPSDAIPRAEATGNPVVIALPKGAYTVAAHWAARDLRAERDFVVVSDPREIEVVGQPELADERWGFKVSANLGTGTGMLLWRSPLKIFPYWELVE